MTINSGSESDDSDIMKTSFDTGGNARTKRMSALLSKADKLLETLKVLGVFFGCYIYFNHCQ